MQSFNLASEMACVDHSPDSVAVSSYYSAFGLRLRLNQDLPGLLPASPSDMVDLEVWLQTGPGWPGAVDGSLQNLYFISTYEDEHGDPSLIVYTFKNREYFRFEYSDGANFIVNERGTAVWASWPNHLSSDEIALYLQGPILGFVLRLRGRICLHASAVAVGEEAFALLGPSGAGKSTTAAAFANQGYAIVSDDIVGLRNEGEDFWVQPGHPRLRLWPEAVGALYDLAEALPRLTPSWNKRYLDLGSNGYRFQSSALPLAAIYILGERISDPAAPRVEGVRPQHGFASLVANTYRNDLSDLGIRSRDFPVLAHLASAVPVRTVNAHCAPSRLERLCKVILDDFVAVRSR